MLIKFLEQPLGDVIASEINIDSFVGDFIISNNDTIMYRPPKKTDYEPVFVNSNISYFAACVEIWNEYSYAVTVKEAEDEQLSVVREMKRQIEEIENFSDQPDSFWPTLIEQAEYGML